MLQLSQFKCGYPTGFSVGPIDLKVDRGAFVGILGPNGSGKSTLFKGIAGEISSLGGEVMLNGKRMAHFTLRDRARIISVVSQFTDLSMISVEDYVLMGRIPHRKSFQFFYTEEDQALARHYMELTGITHLKDKMVTELSGGEQQVVAIASALTQQPKVILLDEPTSHLDITHQMEVMNLLQRLNAEEGLTVVMIIHDLNLASEYCSHLVLMKKGGIVQQGLPADVLTYQNIEMVYNTVVVVQNNPVSNIPFVFPISERSLKTFKASYELSHKNCENHSVDSID